MNNPCDAELLFVFGCCCLGFIYVQEWHISLPSMPCWLKSLIDL